MKNRTYMEKLEHQIATIYRTSTATFGPVTVPESAELRELWGNWEAEEYGLGVTNDGN